MKKTGASKKRAATIREQVEEFHRAFGQLVGTSPAIPSDAVVRFRLRLIRDEFFELLEASLNLKLCGAGHLLAEAKAKLEFLLQEPGNTPSVPAAVDLVEFADALADLDYVVEGTRPTFGIDGAPIAAEVHRSNMAKLGPDGKPIKREDGKILKPEGWEPPNVAACLEAQGWLGSR